MAGDVVVALLGAVDEEHEDEREEDGVKGDGAVFFFSGVFWWGFLVGFGEFFRGSKSGGEKGGGARARCFFCGRAHRKTTPRATLSPQPRDRLQATQSQKISVGRARELMEQVERQEIQQGVSAGGQLITRVVLGPGRERGGRRFWERSPRPGRFPRASLRLSQNPQQGSERQAEGALG